MKTLRLLLILLPLTLLSSSSFATTWYAVVSGNDYGQIWSQTANGAATFTGYSVAQNDDIVINDGVTVTLNGINFSITNLSVPTTGKIVLGAGTNATTITVNGNALINGIIDNSSSNSTLTFTMGATTMFYGTGSMLVDQINTTNSNFLLGINTTLNSSNTGLISQFSGGSVTLASGKTLTLISNKINSINSNKFIIGGSIYCGGTNGIIYGVGSFTLNGNSTTNLTSTYNTGSKSITTTSTTALAQGMAVSGTGIPANTFVTAITNGTTFTISQNPISNGTLATLTITSAGNIETSSTTGITGNITVTGTETFSSTGNYIYDGTNNQTDNSLVTTPTTNTFNNLTLNNANGLTFNKVFTVTGTLSLTNGPLYNSGSNITMGTGATIIRTAGYLTNIAPTFGTSVNVIYNGAANITTGSELPTSTTVLNNLTIATTSAAGSNAVSLGASATVNGTAILTSGVLSVGANTLTFQTGNTPITLGTGTITVATTSNLVFGTTGNLGGTAFTIPNNTFTTAPSFNNLTINRTNSLTMGNQDFTINGTATFTAGVFVMGANTLTFQTGNTPIAVGTGTITVATTSNLVFGTTGNLGGSAFTIPNTTFTAAPSINNLTINRTNSLTLGTQEFTINGTLTLTAGVLVTAANSLKFQTDDIPIAVGAGTMTVATTTSLVFGTVGNTGGAAFTIPNNTFTSAPSINNFTINRTNSLTLGNQSLTY